MRRERNTTLNDATARSVAETSAAEASGSALADNRHANGG
jgi:hypothetical protein